jgi:hypothetical protein
MDLLKCNLNDAKEFIALLFEGIDCYIEFRFIKDKEITQRFHRGTQNIDWNEIQDKNANGFNVFFGVCGRMRESGKKQDVSIVPAFWVDLDSKSPCNVDIVHRYFDEYAFEFFPSYTIASGHGAHAYWFLEQPIAITSDQARAKAEGYLLGLAQLFHGDHVHDLSRMMRLPETINWKNIDKPVSCEIATCDNCYYDEDIEARRFKLEDFESFYIESSSSKGENIIFSKELSPPLDVAVLRVSDHVKKLITNPPLKGERSSAVFVVVSAMKEAGYSPDEVKSVLMNYPIGDRYGE